MGIVFSQPLSNFWIFISTGPLTFIKYLIIKRWLEKRNASGRLRAYDPEDTLDLTKLGAVIPLNEHRLEQPRTLCKNDEVDSILFYGSNSGGDILVCCVSRELKGHVSWLYLGLSDGHSYQSVEPEEMFVPGNNFIANGLRIKCLSPMRKWRISFSGFLREFRRGEECQTVHIKFSFICISSSFAFDLNTDTNSALLAEFLARETKSFWPKHPDRLLTDYMDSYIQAVNIIGTVSASGQEEQEIYLWGAKQRNHGNTNDARKFEFFGYTKEGQLIYVAEYEVPDCISKFSVGYYLERCTLSWPVTSCCLQFHDRHPRSNGVDIKIDTERSSVSARVHQPTVRLSWPTSLCSGLTTYGQLNRFELHDGDCGFGLILEHTQDKNGLEMSDDGKWRFPILTLSSLEQKQLILTLNDVRCSDPLLSGGKGSSISSMLYLSNKFETGFEVPNGFVLTTLAWEYFVQSQDNLKDVLKKFEQEARHADLELCKTVCKRMTEQIESTSLPSSLLKSVQSKTEELFGNEGPIKYFAVRSSCKDEDSEDTSSAGQMKTFLGVKGIQEVSEAILQCWASQFSFPAMQYKIQNGLDLVSPMAVVVQEMVEADAAGALFTCDPLTGNPQKITLTANYGLGESVMSASTDPDTIFLERNQRNEISLSKIHVGEKKLKVVLTENGIAHQNNDEEHRNVCCVSLNTAMHIADICIKLEEASGFPVDVEWAIRENVIYLLQVRPITTFDLETRFELAHAVDHGMRAENEFNTKANIGEVMPDAFSHLGLTYIFQIFLYMLQDLYGSRNKYIFPFNPFYSVFPYYQNHVFISMPNFVLRFYDKENQSTLSQSNLISGFGRLLDDQEMFQQADKRNQGFPGSFVPYQFVLFIIDLLFSERELNKFSARLWKEKMDLSTCSNSKEMFLHVWKRCVETVYGMRCQLKNTFVSSIYNSLIMSVLATANKGWDINVYNDFALILSSCGNVESADIPQSIKNLVKEIQVSLSMDKFKEMEPEAALSWLESTNCSAGMKFKEFIQKHGHRGTKDYDIHSKPWRENKLPLMKILQESSDLSHKVERENVSPADVLAQLKIHLNWKDRLLLRFLIPLSRRAVVNRERGKSLIIKQFDLARQGFWKLAECMEQEGRIPDKDLMFFLTNHEVFDLVNSSSPALVQKAFRRRKIFPDLNQHRFPEISKGFPMPVTIGNITKEDDKGAEIEISGTPVSPGIVQGIARVVSNIQEAGTIKTGDILIAYSTDVSWTPYFPLLKGVATELGGLISHGAVVAREYGLPCVVGLFGVTYKFKTGDLVLLDANKGCLKKMSQVQA